MDTDLEALKARVRDGNQKLWVAWCQLKGMVHDREQWSRESERWAQAKEKLWLLIMQLREQHNFYDCLYIENGKKTRGCLHNEDGFFCQVCPCITNEYWEKELMNLPSPSGRRLL